MPAMPHATKGILLRIGPHQRSILSRSRPARELPALVFPAVRRGVRSKPPAERTVNTDRGRIDLGGEVEHQTLGAIRTLLEKEPVVQGAVRQQLPHDQSWVLGMLPR